MQLEMILPRAREAVTPWAKSDDGRWSLVHDDSAKVLARWPDQCVDLVFADPPYHLSNDGTTVQSGKRVSVNKGAWDTSRGRANDRAFHRRWLEQVRAVLKPSGTAWVSATRHALFAIGDVMDDLGFHILNLVTWHKPNASPDVGCRMFASSAEHLLWAAPRRFDPLRHVYRYDVAKRENGGVQMRDVWTFPTTPKREKKHGDHPTQKPLALLDRIVRLCTEEGALVVDPFNGSGTTGVAALRAGCRFIGIDTETDYLHVARKRLEEIRP